MLSIYLEVSLELERDISCIFICLVRGMDDVGLFLDLCTLLCSKKGSLLRLRDKEEVRRMRLEDMFILRRRMSKGCIEREYIQ